MIIEVNKLIGQTFRLRKQVRMGSRWEPREGCIYAAPIDFTADFSVGEQTVTAKGNFSTRLLATCDRSLRRFYVDVSGAIDHEFAHGSELNRKSEVELRDEELNVSFHLGEIDFSHVLNELVLLALPMKLLSPEQEAEFSVTFGTSDDDGVDERFAILKEVKERILKSGGE